MPKHCRDRLKQSNSGQNSSVLVVILLVLMGSGASIGFILEETVKGKQSMAVSQALIVTDVQECSDSDDDEFLSTVHDDGTSFTVMFEANNGDLVCYVLKLANEGEQTLVVEMGLLGGSPYDLDATSMTFWSDNNHDGRYTDGEALIDQQSGSSQTLLERADVVTTGLVDFQDFTANHWFLDGSGTYNDGVFSDSDGSSPEAILLDDGDGLLDPGSLSTGADRVITPGRADLAEQIGPYASVSDGLSKLFFSDNGGGTSGQWGFGEDIYLNNDGDGFYTGAADLLVDGDGTATTGAGSAELISDGAALQAFDPADDIYWYDADSSGSFTTGDGLWKDSGDNGYFNANGESVSGTSPATNLASTFDGSLDIAFNGGIATTYTLENSGAITARTLSTLGLEGGAPAGLVAGDVVEVDSQGKWYILTARSTDLDQRSTLQVIGDGVTTGDDVSGENLIKQTPTLGAASGICVNGADIIGIGGTIGLNIDNCAGGSADASNLDAGEVWALSGSVWGSTDLGASFDDVRSVATGDLDGDGDLDLVTGSGSGEDYEIIAWDNDGTPFTGTWSSNDVGASLDDVNTLALGDLDNDGDLDLITGSGSTEDYEIIAWDNDGTPFAGTWTANDVGASSDDVNTLALGDLDGDGDLDLVTGSGSTEDNELIAWTNDGTPFAGTWSANDVGASSDDVNAVALGDLDNDGDLDLITGSGSTEDNELIAWANDGTPFAGTWAANDVGASSDDVNSLALGDLDNDGDLDLVSGSGSTEDNELIAWTNDGTPFVGTWSANDVGASLDDVNSVTIGDVDIDGDLDIVSGSGSGEDMEVIFWANDKTPFVGTWTATDVGASTDSVADVSLGDLDDDGDLDFISVSGSSENYELIGWQNPLTIGSAAFPNTGITNIGTSFSRPRTIEHADIDGDGDIDMLGAADVEDDISWFENTAGDGSAWTEHLIDGSFDEAYSVVGADMDGDGDMDVVGAARTADDISWWENTAGDGSAWTEHVIDNNFDSAVDVKAADLDGDGDMDVVAGAWTANDIAWWENTAGDGSAWTKQVIDSNFKWCFRVATADVDGDGDMDVLGAAYSTNLLAWFENTAGDGSAWTRHTIANWASDQWLGTYVNTGDIDGDGDLDVTSAASSTGYVAWFENTAGDGSAWTRHNIYRFGPQNPYVAHPADLDSDGDLDVLMGWPTVRAIRWAENTAGDGSAWTTHYIDTFPGSWEYFHDLDAADINGDGKLNIIGAGTNTGRIFWIGNTQTIDYSSSYPSVYVVVDEDGTAAATSIALLGEPGKALPDNLQFYPVSLVDSATTADLDDFYLDSGADIAASLDAALGVAGSATFGSTGFGDRYKIDSPSTAANSAVVVTDGSIGTNIAGSLKLGAGNGGTEAGPDQVLRGSPTDDTTVGSELVTGLTLRFAFVDTDGDGVFDLGEDLYEETTGGAGTYSSGADTLVHVGTATDVTGGSPGTAGSATISIDDDDNIMFRDSDHDSNYDFSAGTYEPLIYTGSDDVQPGGILTAGMEVLARSGGDWPALGAGVGKLDTYRLESDFDGLNGHDYYFIDHYNTGVYTDGVAIIDQIAGTDGIRLEEADVVIHHGLANLLALPIVTSNVGSVYYKFELPAASDRSNPLEVRVNMALEDAAPTGFYEVKIVLRAVNH